MTNGITKRWFLNTICIIIVFLAIFISVFLFIMHNHYYATVDMALNTRAFEPTDAAFFNGYLDSSDAVFESRATEFIDLYSDNDTMEIWIIDRYGKVILSSSHFPVEKDVELPEYAEALESDTKSATWTGRNPNGEKIRAVTVMLPYTASNNGAIRYMISLSDVDAQFRTISFIAIMLSLLALGLVCFSGIFLIQSIVLPVKKINDTAKTIAKGNYNAVIQPQRYDDEIAELCRTFNAMANAIGSADKIKNDFISTVSHELRTPLTAIKGWGETILDVHDTDPATTKKGLKVIIKEAERLNSIVEELLDFSKMESGRLTLRLDMIDVLAELDDAAFVFRDRAAREGIEISYNTPDLPAPMNGDANRIKQVFVNILDNSLKYTPQGGKIDISASINDSFLNVKISDTGCGIPPEALKHVKEKFFKANLSAKGSGIGLAVCEEIVKLHAGALNISSQVDVGTTVEVILPLTMTENP